MIVLDSSALLALLLDEPGADVVFKALTHACISTVNLAEVWSRVADYGGSDPLDRQLVAQFELCVEPFSEAQALRAAELRKSTRSAGLSLGDRACLALALDLGAPVLTADRAWSRIDVGVEIRLIR